MKLHARIASWLFTPTSFESSLARRMQGEAYVKIGIGMYLASVVSLIAALASVELSAEYVISLLCFAALFLLSSLCGAHLVTTGLTEIDKVAVSEFGRKEC